MRYCNSSYLGYSSIDTGSAQHTRVDVYRGTGVYACIAILDTCNIAIAPHSWLRWTDNTWNTLAYRSVTRARARLPDSPCEPWTSSLHQQPIVSHGFYDVVLASCVLSVRHGIPWHSCH